MKRFSRRLLFTLLTINFLNATTNQNITPKFTIRSQGTNAARRAINSTNHIMLYDINKWYGTFSLTPEYTRSFNNKNIAECLFGDLLCNKKTLKIQGSRVTNRDEKALLADYFYLPTDFQSDITFKPIIQNFLVDVNFFLGLDEWISGLYLFTQFPITYTKWDLNCCETVKETGTLAYLEGYFATRSLDRENDLLGQFTDYLNGKSPGTITDPRNTSIATKLKGLSCAKICCGTAETNISISELRFALGYNFLLEKDYHVGINLQLVAPTGNKIKSDLLFAPQNGNGGHWEFGGALNAGIRLWHSEDEKQNFNFYFDANLTHMFKNCQKRCFDLCNKPLSRYMLAEKMIPFNDVTESEQIKVLSGSDQGLTPSHQFNHQILPVANITSLNVNVNIKIIADIIAMFNYTNNNYSFDIGYNYYVRSCEKITLNCNCDEFKEKTWSLKGDSHIYGYGSTTNQALPLSATMNNATIHNGDNFGIEGVSAGSLKESLGTENRGIDNPNGSLGSSTAGFLFNKSTNGVNLNTSLPPILITQNDINFVGTKNITHKIFSHLSYNWLDTKENWIPYIGVGFEIEFAHKSSNCDDCTSCYSDCNKECDINKSCINCGLDQWGILIKGGLSF